MKKALFGLAICFGSTVSAHTIDSNPSQAPFSTLPDRQEHKVAMDERMGQLQLDMLIGTIVESDHQIDKVASRSGQTVASRDR